MRKQLLSIILWSMIAAAFIGPGTVTTASAAGAGYGYSLIWSLVFAIFACIVLQEASARITILIGKDISKVMTSRFTGTGGLTIKLLIGGSVIFGCAAYQGGNILGAISGIQLITDVPKSPLVFILIISTALLLFFGTHQNLAKFLSLLVGLLGLCFLYIVAKTDHNAVGILKGFIPNIPPKSEWLVLGLVGTTIVPYNLFLGSGISRGQNLPNMRLGLVVAVVFGGIISIAILITGTFIVGEFSFQSLAMAMQAGLGEWAVYLLAAGLFAAGFTSSVTAPLAAGFIARGFFSANDSTLVFRLGWGVVLISGLIIGLLDFKPIPIILMAQALNGLILPAISLILMILVNDPKVLPAKNLNTVFMNIAMTLVVVIVSGMGANNIYSAISTASTLPISKSWFVVIISLGIGCVSWWKLWKIRFSRQ